MSDTRPPVTVEADDPRLADYAALNDPAARRRVERAGDYFVVEGILAVERLLDLPQWSVRSVLVLPKLAGRVQQLLERHGRHDEALLVADEALLRSVVGFDLHRGVLASVTRTPPIPLDQLAAPPGSLLVVAEGVNDHENLGALYRNAAAFGAASVVLDPTCADPFYRRSVRVSLGHVLAVPTVVAPAFPDGLVALHARGVTTVALTPGAETDVRDLDLSTLGPGPVAVVVGAEGQGLTAATLEAADHRVAIAMAPGVDSLNVATAAAVALHQLQRR